MNIIGQQEVLIRDKQDWLYFSEPRQIIVATTLQDIIIALHEVEKQVEEHGWYAAGFISYEAASGLDPVLETHKTSDFPYLWFGLYAKPKSVSLPKTYNQKIDLAWKPSENRNTYTTAIGRIRRYISQGKTYQVNYTLRLQADFDANPWNFFIELAQSQNQHAAYVDTGRYVICSASPELFFELDGESITSRPMKGTARRGLTTQEDIFQAEWLGNSEKNRAENVMIVDMIRNDMGRIAKIGSVSVPELFSVERFPTLWQMTSTVTAHTSASLTRIFSSLFPCASISGAPKVSTMRIIRELEATPRKIYTGTIGYLSPGRRAKFNVAIRTALIDRLKRNAEYGIGGGIVWDSTSADEYSEALLKARVLTEPFPVFSLLETMLWTPEEGFFLQEKHIERLLDSANYFGFMIARPDVEQRLHLESLSFAGPQRVRLLVDRNGRIEITAVPISLDEKTVRVALADKQVDSSNQFLYHKTTHRNVYDQVRKHQPDFDDVLLYNERNEVTEFTIGNLVVELDGKLITPPAKCGLLPGTFRAHLLESHQVVERIIPILRLKDCSKIYRINSVRRWETVHLQEYN